MFGGKELQGHNIPKVYGAIEPTAVYVPIQSILGSEEGFKTATTEVFGPLQVLISAHQHVVGQPITSITLVWALRGAPTPWVSNTACHMCLLA